MKHLGRSDMNGFSLIEVIVGIAILGIVTLPVCAGLVLSFHLNTASRSLMTAQLQASAVVETLMAEGIDPNDTYPATRDNCEISATPQEGGRYYEVEVTCLDGGQSVTLTTSIRAAEGGGP